MGIVSGIAERCKRCYACVRECPAKAIKVEHGQAIVLEDRCIVCGNCIKVCAQGAKRIQHHTDEVMRALQEDKPVFACLAPSFPAAFDKVAPGKIITGLRQLGFDQVWSVAFGAELVAREYARLFEEARRSDRMLIATPCPAVVSYVEKYMPRLRNALAPVVSPMIAVARAIHHRCGPDVRVVFIGPCIAKKNEILDPFVAGHVSSVLSFKELQALFDMAGINPETLDESAFDGPQSLVGGAFPLPGGLLRTSGISADVLDNELLVAEGKDRVLAALHALEEGTAKTGLADLLFCEGCINGPKMLNTLSTIARKQILADYVNQQLQRLSLEQFEAELAEFRDVPLDRAFSPQDLRLREPSEEEVENALRLMRKFRPEDQLNCGACGYPTCREKAVAVCQGLAEATMCLPYLIEELEEAFVELQQSHRDLESAQQRLVQSERLASMGQLSAGVAHELNNPLGTVLLYSHMLLRQIKNEDPRRADIEMIAAEATRCKKIVRGLLDFARRSRVSKAPTDLARLIEEVRTVMAGRANQDNVQLTVDIDPNLPIARVDGDQVKQMLINLVSNAMDAISGQGGRVQIRAALRREDNHVVIQVVDNGCGIPREHLGRLFTPFFTTKEIGKGTGLGLAIAYGIVKMHSGDIHAESEEGKGTTFTVAIPVEQGETALVS